MNRSLITHFCLAASISALTTPAIHGKTLNSMPFSFGYGFDITTPGGNPDLRSWNTNETASTNTPTTQGDFSFTPAPAGGSFSGSGVGFPDRVLTDRLGYAGHIEEVFEVPVTASYNGAAPGDAAETPNFRLRLEISKISIYAGEHEDGSLLFPQTGWDETTPEHGASSPTIELPLSNDFNEVLAYAHLVWDPEDYDVPLVGLNDPFTRIFDIAAMDNMGDLRFVDGLEVEGRVSLVYDAIPGAGVDGDYNDDGTVDAADYTVWRDALAGGGTLQNEGASPGVVDEEDYTFWKSSFGNTAGGGLGSSTAVPEPSSGLLLTMLAWFVPLQYRTRISR